MAVAITRAIAGARRTHLLPLSRWVSASDFARSRRQASVAIDSDVTAPTSLWLFSNVHLLADEGIVVHRDSIIRESAKAPWAFDRLGVLPIGSVTAKRLETVRVATITVPALHRSWGHWLLDAMARLYLLDEVFNERDVNIVVGKSISGNYLKALEAYLPDDYQLLHAPKKFLEVSELLLPGYMPVPQTGTLPPALLHWLRKIIMPRPGLSTRRLYVARPAGIDRQMQNEGEVRAFLVNLGFEAVAPERLSFSEQVELFASACAVVGTHGSGLTGIIYMAVGGNVVELFPAPAANAAACPRYNQRIANSVGLHYSSVHGTARRPRDSFSIPINELARVIEESKQSDQEVQPDGLNLPRTSRLL